LNNILFTIFTVTEAHKLCRDSFLHILYISLPISIPTIRRCIYEIQITPCSKTIYK
jgi:hypothetical protein